MYPDLKIHKIVHFDLKGAPPKLCFFKEILHFIKRYGATGVLLEWEDTFPYSGNLAHLGSVTNSSGDEMYSMAQVQEIFGICKELNLDVIQLVQTIGHMEFVLKHSRHEHLREYCRSPAIICPVKQESQKLAQQMVMQVLAVQPDAKYFHIGADEVCHLAICRDCSMKIRSTPHDQWRIYLDYVRELVVFIKKQWPEITILMWDDMIRLMYVDVLQEYPEITKEVELVVWNYEPREMFHFPPDMWFKYKELFPKVWAGSAYKGANGSSQLMCSVPRYVSNQDAWLNEMTIASTRVKFVGVILTGWSRFDHYATLCELLPVSMNSLANCLKCYVEGNLKNHPELSADNTLALIDWPRLAVADCVMGVATAYQGYLRLMSGDLRTTWLNNWQLANGFLNTFHVDNIDSYTRSLVVNLDRHRKVAVLHLESIYGPRTCSEWVQTYIGVMEIEFKNVLHAIRLARRYDPRFPEYVPRSAPSTSGNLAAEATSSKVGAREAAEKASSTALNTPSSAGQASLAAGQATSAAGQASSSAGKLPATADQAPSTAGQTPSTSGKAPSFAGQAPSTAGMTPSIAGKAPSTAGQAPSTTGQAPSTAKQAPSTTGQATSTAGQAPSTAGEASSTAGLAPSSTEKTLSLVEAAPSTVNVVFTTVQHVTSTIEHVPTTG